MTKAEIQDLKSRIDLRELASKYTELKGGVEKYGTCPKCGGTDRFHVGVNMFFCRQCLPISPGKGRKDVFDFLIWIGEAKDFKGAIEYLANERRANPSLFSVRQEKPEVDEWTKLTWDKQALAVVESGAKALATKGGAEAREYLENRGIKQATWESAKLGAVKVKTRFGDMQAISIPWIDDKGKITAIQNRLIDPIEERYTRWGYNGYYGNTALYNLPIKSKNRLIIVEGELNALSIFQERQDVTVVSIGSQNYRKEALEALKKTSNDYKEVFIWFDDFFQAKELLEATGIKGKVINTNDLDANDLLQNNQLNNILTHEFEQEEFIFTGNQ